jgi:hypothetical protein
LALVGIGAPQPVRSALIRSPFFFPQKTAKRKFRGDLATPSGSAAPAEDTPHAKDPRRRGAWATRA